MQQSFYNDLRKPRSAQSSRSVNSFRHGGQGTAVHSGSLINYQKREKLKSLLVTKFMKKYHLRTNEAFIEEEVKNFLHKETLTDNDLKNLDKKIHELLQKKTNLNHLENHLKSGKDKSNTGFNFNEENLDHGDNCMPDNLSVKSGNDRVHTAFNRRGDNDAMSVKSGLSGASKLSQAKPKKKDLTEDDLELLSMNSDKKEPLNRIQFGNERDEWDAINKYNQQAFIQDKLKEKFKDKEIKKRTKEDLDNQIKQKLIRQNAERMKDKEYDKITIDHVEVLNKMEAERLRDIKEKSLREKINRDAQLQDEKKKRRLEELKNKKYDKQLCKI